MGLCFSCFGRRRQRRARSAVADNERDPLIGTQRTSYSSADLFNRTAQVAAALRSGKLPSQQQLEHILQSVLQSDVLKVSAQGTLSPEGVKVIEDVRELVTVLLIVGLEKNRAFCTPAIAPSHCLQPMISSKTSYIISLKQESFRSRRTPML